MHLKNTLFYKCTFRLMTFSIVKYLLKIPAITQNSSFSKSSCEKFNQRIMFKVNLIFISKSWTFPVNKLIAPSFPLLNHSSGILQIEKYRLFFLYIFFFDILKTFFCLYSSCIIISIKKINNKREKLLNPS